MTVTVVPWFHWVHRWSAWELVPVVDETLLKRYGIREEPRQQRQCATCQYRQERSLNAS